MDYGLQIPEFTYVKSPVITKVFDGSLKSHAQCPKALQEEQNDALIGSSAQQIAFKSRKELFEQSK